MSRNYVDLGYTIHHQELLFIVFALTKSLYIGIVNVIIHVLRVESQLCRDGADIAAANDCRCPNWNSGAFCQFFYYLLLCG